MKIPIVIIPIIFLLGCDKKERTTPKIESLTESVYASGIVKAESQYKVYPEVSGILRKKHVDIGDYVKEGDAIFTIENNSATLASENAELGVARSKENLEKLRDFQRQANVAKNNWMQDSLMYVRQQNLWKQNIGTKVELEHRQLSVRNAKTNYLNSLNQLSQAKVDLKVNYETAKNNLLITEEGEEDYTVKSTLDGRVFTVFLEEGESVNPQTILAVVGKPETFKIEIEVDENDISKVKIGQEIFISMDSYSDTIYKAKVTKIHPIMDEGSGSFTVEGIFTKPPARLYPNLTLEANILVNQRKNALVIPRDFLIDDTYVLVEDDKKVKVNVGLKNYEYAEIINGLEKDQVIYKP